MTETAIVGGGLLGLTLSLRLTSAGHRVTVFESEPDLGGLARADAIGDVRWDRFYHVVLGRDRHLLSLLEDVGLGGELEWASTRTGFFVDGRWYSMSSALDFLRFPPLSLFDKARLGATIVHAARMADGLSLERLSAVEWLTRWSGQSTVDKIWLPLLRSKLGPNAELASAAFIWAIIKRMYGARASGSKRESMGYVRGGYDAVVPALRRAAREAGVTIVPSARVESIIPEDDGVGVVLANGERHDAAHVVMTIPCSKIAAACPTLTVDEQQRLRAVVYQGVVCPSYLLRRPLKGFYVTNLTDGTLPFTGVIEMTALVRPEAFGGRHLVYLPRYLSQEDALWSASDDTIADTFFDALRSMIPELTPNDVVARRVARAREVLAVSTLNYSRDLMPRVATSHPRLSIVNSAQIAQGTLNVDETVALATRSVSEVSGRIRATTGGLQHA